METITNPGDWAQFGLAGMVIFALFAMVGYASKIMISHFKDIVIKHEDTVSSFRSEQAKERETVLSSHREERAEWAKSIGDQQGELKSVVSELTKAVVKLDRRSRDDVA